MGQATGGMKPRRIVGLEGEREPVFEPGIDSGVDPVEVERQQVARSRAELGGTIDAIQERLTPGHIVEQARDGAADLAGGIRSKIGSSVRENPLPALITAAGLGYLMFKAFKGSSHSGSDGYEQVDTAAPYGTGESGSPVDALKSKLEQATGTAGAKVGDVRGTVAEGAQAGLMTAKDVARTARERTSRTAKTVKRAMSQNPMAAVVVALGVGAAAGMAIPSSDVEDRVLGAAGEQMIERARETAGDVGERAKHAAMGAAEAAREEIES